MFVPMLLSMAISAMDPVREATSNADQAPKVVIPLARYDLGRAKDVERLRLRIRAAARSVCDYGYHGVMYLETAACMRNAIADANAQLGKLAQRGSAVGLAATIAVTAK